jgi:hypothetical protein
MAESDLIAQLSADLAALHGRISEAGEKAGEKAGEQADDRPTEAKQD